MKTAFYILVAIPIIACLTIGIYSLAYVNFYRGLILTFSAFIFLLIVIPIGEVLGRLKEEDIKERSLFYILVAIPIIACLTTGIYSLAYVNFYRGLILLFSGFVSLSIVIPIGNILGRLIGEDIKGRSLKDISKLFALSCTYSADHNWKWEYVNECTGYQRLVCSSCRKLKVKDERYLQIIHRQWGEWKYLTKDSCEQQRVCNLCQAKETRKNHEKWGEWEYLAESSCDQQRICVRCQAKETHKNHEKWGDWEYLVGDSCDQQRVCVRCQFKETRKDIHQWKAGEWEPDNASCKQQLVCVRCRLEETHTENHEWGAWEDETDEDDRRLGSYVYERQCVRCGFTRTKEHNRAQQRFFDNLGAAYRRPNK